MREDEESLVFSTRRRHTRLVSDWSSDVCSSDLIREGVDQLPSNYTSVEAPPYLWHDDQGTHHVVLFMFQNVAVPHIVIPAGSCADRRPGGNFEFHNDLRHFSRVHSDRFLPLHLVRIGRARGSVESRRAVVVLRIERLP